MTEKAKVLRDYGRDDGKDEARWEEACKQAQNEKSPVEKEFQRILHWEGLGHIVF